MKLNLDCVRSVLLCVEDNTELRKACCFVDTGLDESMEFVGETVKPNDYQLKLLADYSNDELIYHINYCIEAMLLSTSDLSTTYTIIIDNLTPKGHDFLANIRDNKIWSGVKDVSANVGANSLNAVMQIAANVITEIIKARFGL